MIHHLRGSATLKWPLVILYGWLALLVSLQHAFQVDFGPSRNLALTRHEQILSGVGDAPWVHRVGQPILAEGTRRVFAQTLGIDSVTALRLSYSMWRYLWTFLFFILFDRWLRVWLDPAWAVAGTLLAAALHPATFRYYWFQPDSPPDLVLWVAAALLTQFRRDAWLFPLVVLGVIIRETAIFAIVIHLALRFGSEPRDALLKRSGWLAVAWGVPFAAIRLAIPARGLAANPWELVGNNLQSWWLPYALLFLGPLIVVPWLGIQSRPRELRQLALALVLTYVPLQFVFGRIREVRLFLPMLIVLVPLALLRLREDERTEAGDLTPALFGSRGFFA